MLTGVGTTAELVMCNDSAHYSCMLLLNSVIAYVRRSTSVISYVIVKSNYNQHPPRIK